MVEFHIVVLFALLPLCLGALQLSLLMSENHHIDHATYRAAREAAMSNGDAGSARRAFAQAASILFIAADGEVDSGNVSGLVSKAYLAALSDSARYGRIRIISPSDDARSDFAIRRGGRLVIPNDGLEYRESLPGRRSGLSIQEANVLRLEMDWCRPLIVPFARELLLGALKLLDRDPWRRSCYSAGRVPIHSAASIPMQSDFKVSS